MNMFKSLFITFVFVVYILNLNAFAFDNTALVKAEKKDFEILMEAQSSLQAALFEYKSGNYEKSIQIYLQSCQSGYQEACYALGNIFNKGLVVKKELEMSRQFYEYSCNQKHAEGCFMLSKQLQREGKTKESLSIYKKACDYSINDTFLQEFMTCKN